MDDKEQMELQVRRIMASEIEAHRSFLQSQFKNLTWGIGLIFAAAAIVFAFLFGKSIQDSREQLTSSIDAKVVDYRIVESFRKRLDEYISIAVDNAVDQESTRKKISAQITALSDSVISNVAESIQDQVSNTVKKQLNEAQNLNASEIIARLTLPKNTVISFNRDSCPEGWLEYTSAYGRFIRGVDRSGSGIDPDGERTPGSIQNDAFAAHEHSRPKGVYDAGGGPDSAWVASARFYGFGFKNPPSTGITGGPETRPKNIALLFCEKS